MTRRWSRARAVPALAAPGTGVFGLAALASAVGWPGREAAAPPAVPAAARTGCDARQQNLARLRPGPGPESPP
jgi:hypothetical protein